MELHSPREKLPVSDKLSLEKIDIPKLPTDIMFPEELNRYLRDQIQTLTHENGMLKRALNEKDLMINRTKSRTESLELKIKQYEHFTSTASTAMQGSHADLASSKIVELSKKLRETNADLEGYKTKCLRLENKITQLASEEDTIDQPIVEKKTESPDQIRQLTEKLAATSRKVFEAKNQNMQLTNELKQANKLLAQEIGDGFTSIQNLTSAQSNWRGRAQLILSLQTKLAEFQEKLSLSPMERESNNTIALRQMEWNKRQVHEQVTKDLAWTKTQLEETKKKLEGARARTKVLENEIFSVKTKINALLEKSEHDDQLIKALTSQIGAIEEKHKEKLQEKKSMYDKLEQEHNTLNGQLQREKQKLEQLQKLIDEREVKIEELKSQIKSEYQMRNNSVNISTESAQETVKDVSSKLLEERAIYRASDAERLRLIDLVTVLNERINTIRNQMEDGQLLLKKEKQRVTKLESKIARMEIEKSMSRTSLYSRTSRSSIFVSENKNELEFEDLKNKLELTQEQLLLMETRLDTMNEEKRMDLENFNLIIENTRTIFQDELKRNLES